MLNLIKSIIKLTLVFSLVFLIISFVTSNSEIVKISLFPVFDNITTEIYIIGIVFLGLGALIGGILAYIEYVSKIIKIKKELKITKQDNSNLTKQLREHQLETKLINYDKS
jgi:flagellar biosynthesis protein FlhB